VKDIGARDEGPMNHKEQKTSNTPTKYNKDPDHDGDDDTTEEGDTDHDKGKPVKVPEKFQKDVHKLLNECESKACLNYLRHCITEHEDGMREKEHTFSKEGMPSTSY
jgi:hypothetical protein